MPGDRLRRAAGVLVAVALAGLVLAPLATLARTAWGELGARGPAAVDGAELTGAVAGSVLLALAVTAAAVPVGTFLALALRRPGLPARPVLVLGVLLPVLVPDFVLGYSWTRAYGRAGLLHDVAGVGWAGLLGPLGVGVVLTVGSVPLAYLVVTAGLAARAEPGLERAARNAGAGPVTVLRTVTLPLLGPAIAAASVLVLVVTLGAFAVPQVLGSPAGFRTVTTLVYADLARSSDPASYAGALALALLLAVLAVLVVVPADLLLTPRLRSARNAAPDPASTPHGSPTDRWLAAGITAYLVLAVGVPLVALVATALTRAVGLPPVPASWTLDNFVSALTTRNLEALGRSLALAATAAVLALVLGGCAAAFERGRAGRGVGSLVTLTLVLPGSTVAVALLVTYGRWLGGTAAIIVLAYVAKVWAFAHRPVSGALDRLPAEHVQAARVSGAGPVTVVRTVLLPALAPALLAGWLVCFLTGLHEVTMSSLLYGPDSETFAVVVLNSEELGRVGATAALSVLLTALVVLPAAVVWWVVSRLGRRGGPSPVEAGEVTHAR